jgi:hypothetical protein
MSPNSSSFTDLILAIVDDFEKVGYTKTTDQTRRAYFESLGKKHGLSARALQGIWDDWMFRRKLGKGMFDPINVAI